MGTKEIATRGSRWLAQRPGRLFSWGLLITLACLMLFPASAQTQSLPSTQGTEINHASGHRLQSAVTDENDISVRPDGVRLSPKQKKALMRANFERSKIDAAELAALARGLREALDKLNGDVPTSEVINRAERIEKLAKKIREETKGI